LLGTIFQFSAGEAFPETRRVANLMVQAGDKAERQWLEIIHWTKLNSPWQRIPIPAHCLFNAFLDSVSWPVTEQTARLADICLSMANIAYSKLAIGWLKASRCRQWGLRVVRIAPNRSFKVVRSPTATL
jgi:hypothetical protein